MGWLELIGTVFCIDTIVPGFIVYYVNYEMKVTTEKSSLFVSISKLAELVSNLGFSI